MGIINGYDIVWRKIGVNFTFAAAAAAATIARGEDRRRGNLSSHYISVIRDGICINRAGENRNSTASNSQVTMYNLKGVRRGGRGVAPYN